ncbi:hypothetical protein CIB48_g9689 [Xylaria polymorpha]|nr:hypothetical protein CIB48_g9689 [Xylaria polymorpha]
MTYTWVRKHSWKKVNATGNSYPNYLRSLKRFRSRSAFSRKLGRRYGGAAYPKKIGLPRQYGNSEISPASPGSTMRNKNIPDDDPFATPGSTSPTRRLLFPPATSPPWSSRSAPALIEHDLESVPKRSPSGKRRQADKSLSQDVDDKIIEVLLKPLSKRELDDKVGNNYLFEVVPAGDTEKVVVKIGHTTMSEQRRLRKISNQCNHFSMEREADPEGGPISLYQKAEKLMQAELYDCTYYFACACGVAHREYFDVDKTTAREVIRRWRAFCELEPYDSNGKLRPFWVQRLRERKLHRKNDGGHEGLGEQEERRLRWKQFTTPTQLEKLSFDITYALGLLCLLGWEDVALLEALVIVFITSASELALAWGLVILIGFLVKKLSKN